MTSSKATPKVSIIMNCFNGEKYLSEAIESVINQTYTNWELILWDNCSTDGSARVFKSYSDDRLKYFLSDEHTTLGQARANAWHCVTGEYVAILDVDDLWMPRKLEYQIPLFDDSEVGLVISDTFWFSEKKQKRLYANSYPKEGYVFSDLLKHYFVSLQTLVCRKSFVDQLDTPSFDSEFSMIADFDLVMRLSRISKLALVKKPLAKWRIHGNNLTYNLSDRFYVEKCTWIKKHEGANAFFDGYNEALVRFKYIVERSEIIRLVEAGEKKMAFLMLKKRGLVNVQSYVIMFFIMAPFSKRLIHFTRLLRGRVL